jgi:lipopolysaccharide transport system permease protein
LNAFLFLWRHRHLILHTTYNDIQARYSGSMLGSAWALLNPMMLLGVYIVLYVLILRVRAPGGQQVSALDYTLVIFAGLIPWFGFSESISTSLGSIVGNPTLLHNTSFPAPVLPVKAVLASMVSQAVGLAIFLALLGLTGHFSVYWLFLPLAIGAQVILSLGLGWILAVLNVFIRDLGQAVSHLLLFLMFMSPIAYTREFVGHSPHRFVLDPSRTSSASTAIAWSTATCCAQRTSWGRGWSACSSSGWDSASSSASSPTWSTMSRELAVRLKDVSKSYIIYADPKYWLADFVGLGRLLKEEKHYRSLWALRDVNLEILIIDEILSAGDLYFQAKCLGRIQELTSGPGTTVVYVSHDFESAQSICDTFVWLERGRIVAQGPSGEVRAAYEDSIRKQHEVRLRARNLRLNRRSLSALQAAGEEGLHLLGQFALETADPRLAGPHVCAIRLYVRGGLAEEIRVGGALDDNSVDYRSFVVAEAANGTWSPPQRREARLTRAVRSARSGLSGARFALFVPHDDFTARDFGLELEVDYQDSSRIPCHVEVDAGLAGLKRILTLEHVGDGRWKTARTVVPRWVYLPSSLAPASAPTEQTAPANDGQAAAAEAPAAEAEGGARLSPTKRFGTGQVLIDSVKFLNEEGQETFVLQHGRPMPVVLSYHAEDRTVIGAPLIWASGFQGLDRTQITAMVSSAQGIRFEVRAQGCLAMRFERLLLCNGTYRFSTALFSRLDLHGYNPHFTTSPYLYDMLANSFELLVEGAYPAESWIFRHPLTWESVG